jgi:hypothetical protein
MITRLENLENINQIERLPDSRIRVSYDTKVDNRTQTMKFTSVDPFTPEEIEMENARLLGFTNGMITKADMEQILVTIKLQTGVQPEMLLHDPVYDLSEVRKLWCTIHGFPFFRFVLQYDPGQATITIDESHNEAFMKIAPEWIGAQAAALVPDPGDQVTLVAYEAIYQLAGPLLPEDDELSTLDPLADIPMIGAGGHKQIIDLGRMQAPQIIPGTGNQ